MERQFAEMTRLALAGIDREFPNKPAVVLSDLGAIRSPREMHPAFFGCFDWHSAVHSHWLLVRLLRLFPSIESADAMRTAIDRHLSAENLDVEAAFFGEPVNAAFERMYGWAWLLRLSTELREWNVEESSRWLSNLAPLEAAVVHLIEAYLPVLAYPNRSGQHPDTGFALGQVIDYAIAAANDRLLDLAKETARRFYRQDVGYPFAYEPSGEDFFSSGLNTADLMRRILDQQEFAEWFEKFLPDLSQIQPIPVASVTDGKLVHLAGLNLSRAWCLQGIAAGLPVEDSRVAPLNQSAADHAAVGDQYVFSGHYEGEHWLATFSVYHHTKVGVTFNQSN